MTKILSCVVVVYETELKYGEQSNIDENELYLELNLVDEFLPNETTNVLCVKYLLVILKLLSLSIIRIYCSFRTGSKLRYNQWCLRCGVTQFRVKLQTAPHIRFEHFENSKPHHRSSKPRYAVRFSANCLCGLMSYFKFITNNSI